MDEYRKKLVEEYEELSLALLMDRHAEEDGARFLEEFEKAAENTVMPDELDQACKKHIEAHFAKAAAKKKAKHATLRTLKAAVLVCVILGVLITTAMSVEAVRVPVLNFFLTSDGVLRYLGNEIIDAESNDSGKLKDEENKLSKLGLFVPLGYELAVDNSFDDYTGKVIYENENEEQIALTVCPTDGTVNLPTEGCEAVEMKIMDYEAVYINDGNRNEVMWTDSETEKVYVLYSTGLNETDFWKLAYAMAG